MKLLPNTEFTSPLEQELLKQEKRYKDAFHADAEFQVLKDISQTIKSIKEELAGQERNK
jgi:hypothetical protein